MEKIIPLLPMVLAGPSREPIFHPRFPNSRIKQQSFDFPHLLVLADLSKD